MSLSAENRALVERTLPGNASLTNFMDFRCSHDGLAALLEAARKEAYQQGWNDREGDLIAGINRIIPDAARSVPLSVGVEEVARIIRENIKSAPITPDHSVKGWRIVGFEEAAQAILSKLGREEDHE